MYVGRFVFIGCVPRGSWPRLIRRRATPDWFCAVGPTHNTIGWANAYKKAGWVGLYRYISPRDGYVYPSEWKIVKLDMNNWGYFEREKRKDLGFSQGLYALPALSSDYDPTTKATVYRIDKWAVRFIEAYPSMQSATPAERSKRFFRGETQPHEFI